jgi:hypothetical protein
MDHPLPFLQPEENLDALRSALIVQSGGPALLAGAVEQVRRNHPHLRLTVLLQRGHSERVSALPDVEYIENEGPKPAFVRRLRARRFDVVFVLYTNEPGYWKLKLLPFLVGAPRLVGFDESLASFPVSLRTSRLLARRILQRLADSRVIAPENLPTGLELVARIVLYPAALAWLLAFERAQGLKARLRGSAPAWKRENRPGHGVAS